MKPIMVQIDKQGKIDITPEEIKKIIDDAYAQGYSDGKASVTTPTIIYTERNWPPYWWKDYWYSTPTVTTTDHITISCNDLATSNSSHITSVT